MQDKQEKGKFYAVKLGRAAMGNPWLIRDCVDFYMDQEIKPPPSSGEILQTALFHLREEIIYAARHEENPVMAERMAICSMRAHLGRYFKGLRGAAQMREQVNHMESYAQIEEYLLQCAQNLQKEDK